MRSPKVRLLREWGSLQTRLRKFCQNKFVENNSKICQRQDYRNETVLQIVATQDNDKTKTQVTWENLIRNQRLDADLKVVSEARLQWQEVSRFVSSL